jgi:hypothetical protein
MANLKEKSHPSGRPLPGRRGWKSVAIGGLVLLAVMSDGVVWREDLQEVLIEFIGRNGGQPTSAREAVPFLMDLAVVPHEARRLEHQLKVVDNLLIIEFGKTTGALRCDHVATFP